jgi:hypothetical protein
MSYQLQLCQVLFPPQVRLHVGSERGEAVVSVHDRVHERVQQEQDERVAAADELVAKVARDQDSRVVVHVQERDLIVLLSQREHKSVGQVNHFGEEAQPHDAQHLYRTNISEILS